MRDIQMLDFMWTSISILVISTALLMLQFFRQSKLSWKLAMVLCFVLLILSALNIKNQDDIQKYTIRSLEEISGRVFWDESELTISFQNEVAEIEPKALGVTVKLLSFGEAALPPGQKALQDYFEECKKDEVFEYSRLPPKSAKSLFSAFAEKDGSIYDEKEEMAGVERFWYGGTSSKSTYVDPVLVSTELVKGANVNSSFTSLSDLNGAIILAYINTGFQSENVWPTSINWKLKTSAGHILLYMPLSFNFQRKDNQEFIHKYVGICIPYNFFDHAGKI